MVVSASLRRTVIAAICGLFFLGSSAQAQNNCEGVLIPTEQAIKTDYRLLQSFVKTNVYELYEEIKKSKSSGSGASGKYGAYEGDYNQSASKEDFAKRVEKRLVDENFLLSVQEAKAYYRKGLTDTQAESWLECVKIQSDASTLLVTSTMPDKKAFILNVKWRPGIGVAPSDIVFTVEGGTFSANQKTVLREKYSSAQKKSYFIKRDAGSQSTRVIANIAGVTDAVLVANPIPKPKTLVTKTKECLENDKPFTSSCPGGRAIACFPAPAKAGEVIDTKAWLEGPASQSYATSSSRTPFINFGEWVNPECTIRTGTQVEGKGWHAQIGSCGHGGGKGHQRCAKVRIEYEVKE